MPERPRSRFLSDISISASRKKTPAAKAKADARPCERPGCPGEATAKVPKSRDNLTEHVWVCVKHAREHNESWDYFKGMGDADIQAHRIEAMTGHRPTWPLGKRAASTPSRQRRYADMHAVIDEEGENPAPRRPERHLTRLQIQSLDTMQLEQNATSAEIKARYKELVKKFHPDANGGSRDAEERLKQVIKAYGILRASGVV